MKQKYVWSVRLEKRSVEVIAKDKQEATIKAAKKLGVAWRHTVGYMVVLRLRKANESGEAYRIYESYF